MKKRMSLAELGIKVPTAPAPERVTPTVGPQDKLYGILVKLDALADAIACAADSNQPPDSSTIANLGWLQRDLVNEAMQLLKLAPAGARP